MEKTRRGTTPSEIKGEQAFSRTLSGLISKARERVILSVSEEPEQVFFRSRLLSRLQQAHQRGVLLRMLLASEPSQELAVRLLLLADEVYVSKQGTLGSFAVADDSLVAYGPSIAKKRRIVDRREQAPTSALALAQLFETTVRDKTRVSRLGPATN